MMPEARDRLPGVGPEDMALGFGIHRSGVAVGARPRVLYPFRHENQENILPQNSRSRRRRTRQRKSPSQLPSWYPRTPLRDITAIVNAMQRQRKRLRDAAELQRRNGEAANSTSPLAHELSDSEGSPPPIQDLESPLIVSDLFPDASAMMEKSLQPAEDLLETIPSLENSTSHVKGTVASDKKISDSVDEICLAANKNSNSISRICVADENNFSDSVGEFESIVKENIQRTAKKTMKKSERSTLMSMR